MKIVFAVVLLLHGAIHLLGFLNSFGIAKIDEFKNPIGKVSGAFWLLTFLVFLTAFVLFITNSDYWWLPAITGVIISQILIFSSWQDGKFGTIANFIILIIALTGYGSWDFSKNYNREVRELFSGIRWDNTVLSSDMIYDLPAPVKNWLENSGVVGEKMIRCVRLKQTGLMLTKPGQTDWIEANSVQYITTDEPAFIWKVNMNMKRILNVTGRDLFKNGRGEMLIKLFSLLNIVNKSDKKISQSTMQRYLGEIVWYPSAAVSPYIKWKEIDSRTAEATMSYNGTEGTGTFQFDESGKLTKFSAMRYFEDELLPWEITVIESKEVNGVTLPAKMEATWKLPSGDWTWYKLEITEIEYNKPEQYEN